MAPTVVRGAEFGAAIDTERIVVGESFSLTLLLRTDGEIPDTFASRPDFGGLKLQSGPQRSRQERIVNRRRSYVVSDRYTLIAPAAGQYTIGPSQIRIGNETLTTRAITVVAQGVDLTDLPEELWGEPIVHVVTNDPYVNQQLRGRAFVLPVASNRSPYVGEPFSISYYYFDENLPAPSNITLAVPDFGAMLVKEVHHAQVLDRSETRTLGDRVYRVSLAYRAILTPTRPGEFMLDGFGLQTFLPVERRNRRSQFSQPFFTDTIQILARGGAVSIGVRPLPEEERPPNFSGTVGSFTLTSSVDKQETKADDLVTLKVTLRGVGNVSLASVPDFTGTDDFEVFDTTQETIDSARAEKLVGSKTFEFLLRPKRSGELEIPSIEYTIFDPEKERYVALFTRPHDIHAEGVPSSATAANGAGDGGTPGVEPNLHYIKPLISLRGNYGSQPLTENAMYWALQLGALLIAGVGYAASRRREATHPAIRRRRGAWGEFETYMKAVRASAAKDQQRAAFALETGIRELIGDLFDLSPEGMTTGEIEKILTEKGAEEQTVAAVREALDVCGRIRYAPSLETDTDLAALAGRAESELGGALR